MKGFLGSRGLTAVGVATVALMAAGGGYALAGSTAGTVGVCVSHSNGVVYRGKCHRHDGVLRWNQTGPQGKQGVQGKQGNQGNPGIPGSPGAPGTAKAYGHVESTGLLDAARSSNNVGVSHVNGSGIYCVSVGGASSTSDVAVATPDNANDTTTGTDFAHVEATPEGTACPAGQFEFKTTSIRDSGDNTSQYALLVQADDEGFSFVIP